METLAQSSPARSHLVKPEDSRYAERVRQPDQSRRAPLFGPLPTSGVWTAVGLTRGQFFSILVVSIAMFVFLDGPLWLHTHDSHFWRILWSYVAILPMAAAALYRNGKARLGTIVVASAVVGFVKLVVTALILVAMGLGQA